MVQNYDVDCRLTPQCSFIKMMQKKINQRNMGTMGSNVLCCQPYIWIICLVWDNKFDEQNVKKVVRKYNISMLTKIV